MERPWHKSYVRGVPTTISFEEISLPEALRRSASRWPDRPALVFHGTELTFRDLERAVSKFAGALQGLGVRRGDRVSIVLPNLIQTAIASYGALALGATAVMHHPRAGKFVLKNQFNDAGSEVVICLDLLVPSVLELRNETNVRQIVSCHILDYLPFMAKKLFRLVKGQMHLDTPKETGVVEFMDLLESGTALAGPPKVDMDETAFVLFTSATTGSAKGAELTHRNLSVNVQQIHAWFPSFVDGAETVVGCLPFFHVFGLTCALNVGIFYGYTDVVVPLPEPKNILEGIRGYNATFVAALPSFYNAAVAERKLTKYKLDSLKGSFSGGAPLPLETIRAFEKLTGAQICEGYGLTESSPVTHINPFGGKTKVGTIGLPVPSTDAKIVDLQDPDKEITVPGVPGELCINGPQIMKGYLNLADQTNEAIKGGWLYTGDIVTMDKDGYFSVVDRKKDTVPVGENTVYPREVEEVLFSHPKVRDAGAIGMRDPSTGVMEIIAFVALKKGEKAAEHEIVGYCKQKLEGYKVPAKVEFLDELPRSAVGKTLRKELRRLHQVKLYSKR
ncbi:MAG: long-chain fatty acid--CoA ligase [Desulfomonile sp.]|nr:long-chain fatty acid--CoA ligase [Desulfomonile sp.]